MNTRDVGNGPFVSDASGHPCQVCGDDVAIAYLGLRPGYAEVQCFRGHFLGWAPWPDWGAARVRLVSPSPVDYVRAGYVLVPIPPVEGRPVKGPQGKASVGWNLEKNCIRTVAQAERLNGNINLGLAHLWSRTCCWDIDDYLAATEWLAKRGIALDAYLAAEDAVQIVSGRENRAKLCYKLPDGVPFLPHVPAHDLGFELRCAEKSGTKTLQDCLPPSVHEETLRPYEWKGDWRNFPILPEQLLGLWMELANGPRRATGGSEGRKVPEGDRNTFLVSLAGSMRQKGFGEAAIRAALLAENEDRCDPRLSDAEVAKIAASVAKYPSGTREEHRVLLARGDTLQVEPIQWLWDGWLARGKLHMLAGAPGTGKSTIALALAATATTGGLWPDGAKCTPGDVIVWSDEDDPKDTLLPRFLAAGGDPKRFHVVTGTADSNGVRQFDPATDIPALLAEAQKVPVCALLIVDPVVTIVSGDSHKNTEVRRALQPLVGLASAVSTAVLGISHFTKGTAGGDPVERVTGSVAFGAKPRVVMAAAKFCEGDTERRIFVRAKSNIGPDTGGWEYRLALTDVPGVPEVSVVVARWGEALSGSARDLLAEADVSSTSEPEERRAMDEAVRWLGELLKNGPMHSTWISSGAKQSGVAWRTVERAKARLGVKAIKATYAGGWRWSLPEHCDRHEDESTTLHPESVGGLRKATPLKPNGNAGSAQGRQGPNGHRHSTPLKPSCGAGSTEDRQASGENKTVGGLRSNPGVARVPEDQNSQDRQVLGDVVGNDAVGPDQGVWDVGKNDGAMGVAEGDTRHLLPPAALAEIPPDEEGFPRIKVSIVGANALCVNIVTQSAWPIAYWGDFARRHYGEFTTVVGVPMPVNGDAMDEIRGWLQRLGEDPETISEVLDACARDPGVMAGSLRSTRERGPAG